MPACFGQVQPKNGQLDFFLRIVAVVCSGLPAFLWFHCLSSQILLVICGGLRWFAVVCGGLSFSYTQHNRTATHTITYKP